MVGIWQPEMGAQRQTPSKASYFPGMTFPCFLCPHLGRLSLRASSAVEERRMLGKRGCRWRKFGMCFMSSLSGRPDVFASLSCPTYFFLPRLLSRSTHTVKHTKIQPSAQPLPRPWKHICPFSYLIACQQREEGGQVWCIKWPRDSITHATALWWGCVSIMVLPWKASINTHM